MLIAEAVLPGEVGDCARDLKERVRFPRRVLVFWGNEETPLENGPGVEVNSLRRGVLPAKPVVAAAMQSQV